MDTGRQDGLRGELEAGCWQGRAARSGGSVGGCAVVVGLGRGWSWGILAETTSCPSASFQAHPKAEGALRVSCWVGDLCPPHVMLSEAPPFSCPPGKKGEQVAVWEWGPWVGHQAGPARPLWGVRGPVGA